MPAALAILFVRPMGVRGRPCGPWLEEKASGRAARTGVRRPRSILVSVAHRAGLSGFRRASGGGRKGGCAVLPCRPGTAGQGTERSGTRGACRCKGSATAHRARPARPTADQFPLARACEVGCPRVGLPGHCPSAKGGRPSPVPRGRLRQPVPLQRRSPTRDVLRRTLSAPSQYGFRRGAGRGCFEQTSDGQQETHGSSCWQRTDARLRNGERLMSQPALGSLRQVRGKARASFGAGSAPWFASLTPRAAGGRVPEELHCPSPPL